MKKMQYEADEKLSGQVLISMDRTWAKCAWRMKKYPNIIVFQCVTYFGNRKWDRGNLSQ